MKAPFPDRTYFFDAGLRFECTQCGQCCTGAPGDIDVNDAEIDAIARHQGIDRASLVERYLRRSPAGRSIRERANGDCLFLEEGRCTIYKVRPHQCRTYPFWVDHLRSERAWREAGRECPGIGRGRLYTRAEILEILNEELNSDTDRVPAGRKKTG
jgi:Fe-S-cluster containining protein